VGDATSNMLLIVGELFLLEVHVLHLSYNFIELLLFGFEIYSI